MPQVQQAASPDREAVSPVALIAASGLSISFSGKGHGQVTGSGLSCTGTCSKSFPRVGPLV